MRWHNLVIKIYKNNYAKRETTKTLDSIDTLVTDEILQYDTKEMNLNFILGHQGLFECLELERAIK